MIHKVKHRCFYCEKKIVLSMRGMPCKCGHEFCSKHRLPEMHECTFDRKAEHLKNSDERIASMKCIAKKVQEI